MEQKTKVDSTREEDFIHICERAVAEVFVQSSLKKVLERFVSFLNKKDTLENEAEKLRMARIFYGQLLEDLGVRENPETTELVKESIISNPIFNGDSVAAEAWYAQIERERRPSLPLEDYILKALDIRDLILEASDRDFGTVVTSVLPNINMKMKQFLQYMPSHPEDAQPFSTFDGDQYEIPDLSQDNFLTIRKDCIAALLQLVRKERKFSHNSPDVDDPYSYDQDFAPDIDGRVDRIDFGNLLISDQPREIIEDMFPDYVIAMRLANYVRTHAGYDPVSSLMTAWRAGVFNKCRKRRNTEEGEDQDPVYSILNVLRSSALIQDSPELQEQYLLREKVKTSHDNEFTRLVVTDADVNATAVRDGPDRLIVNIIPLAEPPVDRIVLDNIPTEPSLAPTERVVLPGQNAVAVDGDPIRIEIAISESDRRNGVEHSISRFIFEKLNNEESLADYLAWAYVFANQTKLEQSYSANNTYGSWEDFAKESDPHQIIAEAGLGFTKDYWQKRAVKIPEIISQLEVLDPSQMHYIIIRESVSYFGVLYVPATVDEPAIWRFGIPNDCMRIGANTYSDSVGKIISLPKMNRNALFTTHVSSANSAINRQRHDVGHAHTGNLLTHVSRKNAQYFIAAGLWGIFADDPSLPLNAWVDRL